MTNIITGARSLYRVKKDFPTVTGLWNRKPLKVLNDTKMILDDQINFYSFRINLESF